MRWKKNVKLEQLSFTETTAKELNSIRFLIVVPAECFVLSQPYACVHGTLLQPGS